MTRLQLPQVTLLAATSVALPQTLVALDRSRQDVDYGAVRLLTSEPVTLPFAGEVVAIPPIDSREAYSGFVFRDLARYVSTPFVQIVQWDGFVIDPAAWQPRFLDYDYIGAPWPQFDDAYQVGNGGFSLRSARLLTALAHFDLPSELPEDVAIARHHRPKLERDFGIRFAPRTVAEDYAHERDGGGTTFGFHGAYNLLNAVGPNAFRRLLFDIEPRAIGHRERHDLLRIAWRQRDVGLMAHLLRDYLRDPSLRRYGWDAAGRAVRARRM